MSVLQAPGGEGGSLPSRAYGYNVPNNMMEVSNVQLQGEKNAPSGLKLTVHLVVTYVDHIGVAHQRLQIGDIITSINSQQVTNRQQFTEIYNKIPKAGNFSVDIVFSRPVAMKPAEPNEIPRGYEVISGCRYMRGFIYRIPNCKLGLSVKSYSCKIYVCRITDNTLASIVLSLGDVILDVEGTPVSTVQETSDALVAALRQKGYASMIIEQPIELVNKNIVRQVLTADKTTEPVMLKDVEFICKTEIRRFSANPNLAPVKSAMKERAKKSGKRATVAEKRATVAEKRVSISEQSQEQGVACENNPNLLMPVPIPVFQIQTKNAASPNKSPR